MDRFWINVWIFFFVVTVLICIMMGGLFLLNNSAQNSEEVSMEERDAIEGITYELWDDAKVLVPTSFIILFATAISYMIYKKQFVKVLEDETEGLG